MEKIKKGILEIVAVISFVLFLGTDAEDLGVFILSHLAFLGIFLWSSCLLENYEE